MISARMSRPFRVLTISVASAALAAFVAACGSEHINVPGGTPTEKHGAVLFSQRCAGCHTLSYAATNGSATNARTRQITDGPNFNVRCERPIDRVMYAIENGGFSGAIMPQNVVTGDDAKAVAQFVATYAGRQAPHIVGQVKCEAQPVGTLPPPTASIAGASGAAAGASAGAAAATTSTTSTTSSSTSTAARKSGHSKTKKK
jgi:mono/diheme cytochrome c family protein